MILGYQMTAWTIVIAGAVAATVLLLTVLVGQRIIHFKGRRHRRVHKALGWSTFGLAVVHGLMALAYVFGWQVLS